MLTSEAPVSGLRAYEATQLSQCSSGDTFVEKVESCLTGLSFRLTGPIYTFIV